MGLLGHRLCSALSVVLLFAMACGDGQGSGSADVEMNAWTGASLFEDPEYFVANEVIVHAGGARIDGASFVADSDIKVELIGYCNDLCVGAIATDAAGEATVKSELSARVPFRLPTDDESIYLVFRVGSRTSTTASPRCSYVRGMSLKSGSREFAVRSGIPKEWFLAIFKVPSEDC